MDNYLIDLKPLEYIGGIIKGVLEKSNVIINDAYLYYERLGSKDSILVIRLKDKDGLFNDYLTYGNKVRRTSEGLMCETIYKSSEEDSITNLRVNIKLIDHIMQFFKDFEKMLEDYCLSNLELNLKIPFSELESVELQKDKKENETDKLEDALDRLENLIRILTKNNKN